MPPVSKRKHRQEGQVTAHEKLRPGFTTGAGAAAATAGALHYLFFAKVLDRVEMESLTHEPITVPVHRVTPLSDNQVECVVIKDAGDDPDVTHKAEIGARVTLAGCQERDPEGKGEWQAPAIVVDGKEGVGQVTKPGLEVPPGRPAINPGPMKMIRRAVMQAFEGFVESILPLMGNLAGCEQKKNGRKGNIIARGKGVPKEIRVDIFVPQGKVLAEKTLNARLGIMGGISILGTTGIVRPMSHDAYIATIKSGISVAQAMGSHTLVFTTGRRSERFAMALFPHLPEEAFIQTGDFFKASLDAAAASSAIDRVILTVFFGKAVKMAMGFPHTHAAKSELTMKKLSLWAREITGDTHLAQAVALSNTARHAFTHIHPGYPRLISHVGKKIIASAEKFSRNMVKIDAIIFDFEGNKVFDSTGA